MFTFSSPILFLKAVTKKQVFINTFTKDDGTVVPGHYAMVHVSHDHDHGKVATGGGTYSQKKAHNVVSAKGHYSGLSTEQQAYHVMEHATELQDKETASANVSKYKAAILAGKKPTDVLMQAYLDAPESKRMAINQEFEAKGVADNSAKYLMEYQAKQKKDTAIDAATEHLKTDQKQSDMPTESVKDVHAKPSTLDIVINHYLEKLAEKKNTNVGEKYESSIKKPQDYGGGWKAGVYANNANKKQWSSEASHNAQLAYIKSGGKLSIESYNEISSISNNFLTTVEKQKLGLDKKQFFYMNSEEKLDVQTYIWKKIKSNQLIKQFDKDLYNAEFNKPLNFQKDKKDKNTSIKDNAIQAAIDHLKEDSKQSDLPAHEHKEDAQLTDKLESALGGDEYDAKLNEMAALPKGNYKKQAHDKLSKHPEWSNWSSQEKHDKVHAHYQELQSAASAKSNVNTLKKKLKEGKTPTPTEIKSFLAQPKDKQEEDLKGLVHAGVSEEKLSELMTDAFKQPEEPKQVETKPEPKILFTKPKPEFKQNPQQAINMPTGVMALKPIGLTASNGGATVQQIEHFHQNGDLDSLKKIKDALFVPAMTGDILYQGAKKKAVAAYLDAAISDLDGKQPKDGDTKEGADGTLVFKDGRWHKQQEAVSENTPAQVEEPQAATSEPEKPAESGLEIKTFTHSSKGHTVHSVPIGTKLPDADYKAVAAIAKKHKGFYSSFKKDGAIPGFHFKSNEAAQAFIDEAAPKIYPKQSNPVDAENKKPEKPNVGGSAASVIAGIAGKIEVAIALGDKNLIQSLIDGIESGWDEQSMNDDLKKVYQYAKDAKEYLGGASEDTPVAEQSAPKVETAPQKSTTKSAYDFAFEAEEKAVSKGHVGLNLVSYVANYVKDWLTANPGKEDELNDALKKLGYPSIKFSNGNYESVSNGSNQNKAPIGTKIPMGNGQFEKTEAGWQNQSDKSVLGELSNIGAALEILSGNTPTQEWYDNKNDSHKEVTAEIVLEQNPDLTASKVLSIIYPAGNDGPKEGDIKTIDGVQYVLKNGRWHKVGENESTDEDVTLENIEVPHFNHNGWDNFLSKLKATAIDPLHGEKDIAITVGKKLISFKNKKNGIKVKMWNPEYNPESITDSDKKKIQFMLSLKSLGGGNVNKKLADWLAENDHPVAGYKGKVLKKKPAPKIIFTKTGEPQVSQTIVKSGITVIDNWEKVGDQKGSNPGGAFKDMSGVQWYCKFPSNPDTVRNELLAAKFYQMMGIAVPNLKLVEKDGKLGIASKWVDGLKSVSSSELAKSDGAHEAFAIDAWLANWDVVGLSNDNLLLDKNGKAVRVDVGGSLLYRAQGGEKGADFGNEVTELKTLIDHGKNGKSAAVFGGITKQDIEASAMKVAKIKPDQIRKMVNLFGPGDDAQKTDLANKLIARRQSIIDQVGIADPWDLPPLDQTKLDVNIEDLPKPHDFHNWNGEGKGLSGSQYYNDLNAKTEQDILDFAMKGNLVALKNYQYTEVDKSSGNELGKKSIADHPSNHIQAFWSDCVSALDQIAHPSIESYDLPGVEGSLHEISEASGFYKLGETIDSVKAEKRFGYWLKLSHAVDIDDIIPAAKTLSVGSIMTQTKEWFSNLSDLTKKMIAGIQSSGSYNDAFRDGKETTKDGSSTVKMTAQAYAESVEMPEGTEIYKWMNMPPAMEDLLLNAEKGTILQNPGSMCCSVHPTGTSNFGKHRLKIRYAKGAKGLNSFGSGAFQSEQEITTLPGARFVVLSAKKGNGKDDGLDVELMMLPPAAGYLNDLAERMKTMVKSYVLFFTKITKAA